MGAAGGVQADPGFPLSNILVIAEVDSYNDIGIQYCPVSSLVHALLLNHSEITLYVAVLFFFLPSSC